MGKPQPVVVTTICSLCDQPWEAHGDKPTTEDCIRLLKALANKPCIHWHYNTVPYQPVYPWPRPVQPYWYAGGSYTTTGGGLTVSNTVGAMNASSYEVRTPIAAQSTPTSRAA